MKNKVALITGASSGIGFEFARIFAQNNYDLVLVARDEKKLEELSKSLQVDFSIAVQVISKDLSLEHSAQEIFDEVSQKNLQVEVLVNNAGYTIYGPFSQTSFAEELDMMHVNMLSLVHLTKLFLPQMIERKSGKILNMGSTASFQPGPLMSIYYATKAFVLSFSQAIAEELSGTGVTVTALCPGPTKTGFQSRGKIQGMNLIRGKRLMSAQEVAQAGFDGLMAGKRVVVPGLRNYLGTLGGRFLPQGIVTKYVHEAMKKSGGNE